MKRNWPVPWSWKSEHNPLCFNINRKHQKFNLYGHQQPGLIMVFVSTMSARGARKMGKTQLKHDFKRFMRCVRWFFNKRNILFFAVFFIKNTLIKNIWKCIPCMIKIFHKRILRFRCIFTTGKFENLKKGNTNIS